MDTIYYKVYNPTKEDITVMVKGVSYTAPAEGSANNVPKESAEYWKLFLHSFVKISKMPEFSTEVPTVTTATAVVEEEVKSEPIELVEDSTDVVAVEEVAPEIKEEVVAASKKTSAKKSKSNK